MKRFGSLRNAGQGLYNKDLEDSVIVYIEINNAFHHVETTPDISFIFSFEWKFHNLRFSCVLLFKMSFLLS